MDLVKTAFPINSAIKKTVKLR